MGFVLSLIEETPTACSFPSVWNYHLGHTYHQGHPAYPSAYHDLNNLNHLHPQ